MLDSPYSKRAPEEAVAPPELTTLGKRRVIRARVIGFALFMALRLSNTHLCFRDSFPFSNFLIREEMRPPASALLAVPFINTNISNIHARLGTITRKPASDGFHSLTMRKQMITYPRNAKCLPELAVGS